MLQFLNITLSLLSWLYAQVELMPLCLSAGLSAGQLPLLATLRKFITKSVGILEPDREAALIATTQFAALLGALAGGYASGTAAPAQGGNADSLLQHAAVQLLPSLQVSCLFVPKQLALHSTTADFSLYNS